MKTSDPIAYFNKYAVNANKTFLNKRPFVEVLISGNKYKSLIDSGAAVTAMKAETFNQLRRSTDIKFRQLPINSRRNFSGANGSSIKSVGCYEMAVAINKKDTYTPVFILDGLNTDMILGIDFICRASLIINGQTRKVIMGDEVIVDNFSASKSGIEEISYSYGRTTDKVEIAGHSLKYLMVSGPGGSKSDFFSTDWEDRRPDLTIFHCLTRADAKNRHVIAVGNISPEPIILSRGTKIVDLHEVDGKFEAPEIPEPEQMNEINGKPKLAPKLTEKQRKDFIAKLNIKCPPEYRKRYEDLLVKYHDIFSRNEYDLGWTEKVSHRIKLKHDKPIYTKQFKIPFAHQQSIHEFVKDMLDRKLIEVSRSRYNSPIFCVKKKDGTWRPVVDLRAINKATVEDSYSIRDVKACIDEIGAERSNVFSTMDLTKGFFQQNLEKESRKYTAFTVPGLGSYQFTVSCFGSHGAPSSFSYLMTEVLQNLQNLLSYIDDILGHTRGHEKHLVALENCFQRVQEYNLKISLEKSTFGTAEVEYLGFKLGADGIQPGTDKTKAVRDFPEPKNIKQIRQFVGLASFFRELIPNFSKMSAHLTALTRKDSEWKGGPLPNNAKIAFEQLKDLLTKKPVIAYARKDLPFRVYCDASAGSNKDNVKIPGGLGVVLTQIHEDKVERVVGYASRRLHKHEENYSAYLLELLAITFACQQFHHYLYGSKRFQVFSDHKPLLKLNKTIHEKTMHRLKEALIPYQFDIEYRKGQDQEAADCLSRNPVDKISGEIINFVNKDPKTIANDQKADPQYLLIKQRLRLRRKLDNSSHINRFIEKHHEKMFIDEEEVLWIGMTKDCKDHVAACEICQKANNPNKRTTTAPLKPHPIPQRFNERVHADLVGPLLSNTENKYILVLSDAFTKWLELIPIKDKTSETVVEAILNHWILRHSAMNMLVTDNGREFKNTDMTEICKKFDIIHRTTSPYHPQSNAQCERQNRTIIKYLKTILDGKTLDWEKALITCQFSFNTQTHSSTDYTPYYFRHFITPNIPIKPNKMENSYYENWTTEALNRLKSSWVKVAENLEKAKKNQEKGYNKSTTERAFKAKDLVYVRVLKKGMGINNKFVPQWRGPFEIVQMTSSVTAKIQEPGKKKLMVIHVNNLKKMIGAANLPTEKEDDESDDESDEASDAEDDDDPSNHHVKPEDDQENPNDDDHQRQIAKDEIIPDADLEAERVKYKRHTRSRGPAPEHPLVHKNLLERKRKVGFLNEIQVLG